MESGQTTAPMTNALFVKRCTKTTYCLYEQTVSSATRGTAPTAVQRWTERVRVNDNCSLDSYCCVMSCRDFVWI